jgi:hypothetical protein
MLRVPWRAASAYADLLANPERTGSEFRLFHAIEMRECNVVPRQNWPTLYEARLGS